MTILHYKNNPGTAQPLDFLICKTRNRLSFKPRLTVYFLSSSQKSSHYCVLDLFPRSFLDGIHSCVWNSFFFFFDDVLYFLLLEFLFDSFLKSTGWTERFLIHGDILHLVFSFHKHIKHRLLSVLFKVLAGLFLMACCFCLFLFMMPYFFLFMVIFYYMLLIVPEK